MFDENKLPIKRSILTKILPAYFFLNFFVAFLFFKTVRRFEIFFEKKNLQNFMKLANKQTVFQNFSLAYVLIISEGVLNFFSLITCTDKFNDNKKLKKFQLVLENLDIVERFR